MKSSIALVVFAALTLTACQKSETPVIEESPKAGVTFSAPTLHAHYHPGDTVWFKGNAWADKIMHGYDLVLLNHESGDTLYSYHGHDHSTNIEIDTFWKNTFSTQEHVMARVTVYTDHDKNFVRDEVVFHLLDN